MTLREIGHFFLELGEEFVDGFFWNINWLDANVLVLIVICVAYCLICLMGFLVVSGIRWFLTERMPELVTLGFKKLPSLARYLIRFNFALMRVTFILIVLAALIPMPNFLLVNIVSREAMGLIHIAWATILIYGFIWRGIGGRLLNVLMDLVLKQTPIRKLFKSEQ